MVDIAYPYTFSNGTIADATQVDANFDEVSTVVNGDLDNTNISANAAIALSKLGLAPGSEAFNKSTSDAITWASGLTTDTQPQIAMTANEGLLFGPGGTTAPDVALERSANNTLQLNVPGAGTLINDQFTGTASSNLSSHTANSGNTWTATLGSIELDGAGYVFCHSGTPAVYVASGLFNSKVTATCILNCKTDIDFAGVAVLDSGGDAYYLTSLNSSDSGGGWALEKYASGGSSTILQSLTGTPLVPGNVYDLSLTYSSNGTTVTLIFNVGLGATTIWTGTITDTSYPTCDQVGLFMSGATSLTTGHHIGDLNATYGGTGVLDMDGGTIINLAGLSFSGSLTFGGSTTVTVFPLAVFVGTVTYILNPTGAAAVNLPPASGLGGQYLGFMNISAYPITFNPQAGEQIASYGNGNPVVLLPYGGTSVTLFPKSAYGWYPQ